MPVVGPFEVPKSLFGDKNKTRGVFLVDPITGSTYAINPSDPYSIKLPDYFSTPIWTIAQHFTKILSYNVLTKWGGQTTDDAKNIETFNRQVVEKYEKYFRYRFMDYTRFAFQILIPNPTSVVANATTPANAYVWDIYDGKNVGNATWTYLQQGKTVEGFISKAEALKYEQEKDIQVWNQLYDSIESIVLSNIDKYIAETQSKDISYQIGQAIMKVAPYIAAAIGILLVVGVLGDIISGIANASQPVNPLPSAPNTVTAPTITSPAVTSIQNTVKKSMDTVSKTIDSVVNNAPTILLQKGIDSVVNSGTQAINTLTNPPKSETQKENAESNTPSNQNSNSGLLFGGLGIGVLALLALL